jgi:hypothetical protein
MYFRREKCVSVVDRNACNTEVSCLRLVFDDAVIGNYAVLALSDQRIQFPPQVR